MGKFVEVVLVDKSEINECREDINMKFTIQVDADSDDDRDLYYSPSSDGVDVDTFFEYLPGTDTYSAIGISEFSPFIYACIIKMVGLEDTLPDNLDINELYRLHVGEVNITGVSPNTVKFILSMIEHYEYHIKNEHVSMPQHLFLYTRLPRVTIMCTSKYNQDEMPIICSTQSIMIDDLFVPSRVYNVLSNDEFLFHITIIPDEDVNENLFIPALMPRLMKFYDKIEVTIYDGVHESKYTTKECRYMKYLNRPRQLIVKVKEEE